jgi:hypothetical protein
MKPSLRIHLISLLAVLSVLIQSLPVFGCAFGIETLFSYSNHPDFPLRKYAAGQLGIIRPTYARSYLVVAYRCLTGRPLTPEEQNSLVSLWNYRMTTVYDDDCPAGADQWLQARKAVPGATRIDRIATARAVISDEPWQTYCNCQSSAFKAAASRLKDYVTRYGADSQVVKDWLQAQDAVFSNCGRDDYSDKPIPANIPAPLPDSATHEARQDRAYQMASAQFYSQQFDAAQKSFEAISQDAASPYRTMSGYLAVRAMIRQATLAKELNKALLWRASERIQQLLGDPSYVSLKSDLSDLDSFIAARIAPEKHQGELAAQLAQNITASNMREYTKTLDLILGDDGIEPVVSTYEKLPESVKEPDLTDWVMTMQTHGKASDEHAIAMWKQTQSLPWLVAAISRVKAGSPDAQSILAAAGKVPLSSPARWMLFYYTNQLNIAGKKLPQARADLDRVLLSPPATLPLSAANLLRAQRLTIAQNLSEFVRFGIQKPACLCMTGGIEGVPDDVETIEKTGVTPDTEPLFTQTAGYVLDRKLPLSALRQLARDQKIPTKLRAHIAWTAWVRAVLVGDDASARDLAIAMRPFNRRKTGLIDEYLSATTSEGRKFAANLLMLKFSSAAPNAYWGQLNEDAYGDASGWWWGPKPVSEYGDSLEDGLPFEQLDPLFLTKAQQAQSSLEVKKLATVPTAPNYLARNVLAYARNHPTDPRVPEALHCAVKATRYGATDDATSPLSRQLFVLLHTRYKASPWTKKTPYWY